MLAASGRLGIASKPVLEVNPEHPLIRSLAAKIGEPNKERFEDIIWLLFDEARVVEGEKPDHAFAGRLTRVLLNAIGQPAP
jgi:molecular chaperone HtpG